MPNVMPLQLRSNTVVKKQILILSCILLYVGSAKAQTKFPAPSPLPDRIVVLKLTEDTSMIEFQPMVINYRVNEKPSIRYHAIFKASFVQSASAPLLSNLITFWFHSTSRACRYPSGNFKVLVRADSESIEISSAIERAKFGDVATTFSEPENGCVESLWAHLRKETFLKIAHAQKVEIRFGSMTFHLKQDHLKALRDLEARM